MGVGTEQFSEEKFSKRAADVQVVERLWNCPELDALLLKGSSEKHDDLEDNLGTW